MSALISYQSGILCYEIFVLQRVQRTLTNQTCGAACHALQTASLTTLQGICWRVVCAGTGTLNLLVESVWVGSVSKIPRLIFGLTMLFIGT